MSFEWSPTYEMTNIPSSSKKNPPKDLVIYKHNQKPVTHKQLIPNLVNQKQMEGTVANFKKNINQRSHVVLLSQTKIFKDLL